jgi:hypothetical protein
MIFKLNKDYSSKTIAKHCKDIKLYGAVEGGRHTIESGTLKFVMLTEGAWRGTKSIYYKCVKI